MGRLVDEMIDTQIKVHCTDAGKDFDMHVLGYKPKAFLEVAFQTIKLRLAYAERTRYQVIPCGLGNTQHSGTATHRFDAL